MVLTITGGANSEFQNKRQRRDYYREVNPLAVEGPIIQSRWSHLPITFTGRDLSLQSFPHADAFVIKAHINGWQINRVLIDNDSQADINFLRAFEEMGLKKEQLQETDKPL
jgi:hypothetical protein